MRGGVGAFDARTVAHAVIVPFDQANDRVLGGSPEAYVNNPLRVPEISSANRAAQKNAVGWDHLCLILNAVQERSDPEFTLAAFRQTLKEVVPRLDTVRVTFPVPGRASLKDCLSLVDQFIADKSGGERYEAVTAALFDALGHTFHTWAMVRRATVTAADAPAGMTGDVEYLDSEGAVVLTVEAKDRQLTVTGLKGKIRGLRENNVTEAFFVADHGVRPEGSGKIQAIIDREFASGQNIYITGLVPLCETLLALLGESGRHTFLKCVCEQLNEYSDIHHRRAWAELLARV